VIVDAVTKGHDTFAKQILTRPALPDPLFQRGQARLLLAADVKIAVVPTWDLPTKTRVELLERLNAGESITIGAMYIGQRFAAGSMGASLPAMDMLPAHHAMIE